MPLWDQALIDEIRAVQLDNLPDTCTIKRPINTPNGRGGFTQTFTTVATSVPCRVYISSGASGTSEEAWFTANQEINITQSFLILAWNQDVRTQDFVDYTIPVPLRQSGMPTTRTYKVLGINKPDTIVTATRCRVEAERDVS